MERLKNMKEILMNSVEGQLGNLSEVNAEELGEVVDMIKDFSEAIYYCSITKAMEEREKEEKFMKEHPELNRSRYYMPSYLPMPPMYYGDGEQENNMRMYYNGSRGGNSSSSNSGYNASARGNNARGGGSRGYHDMDMMYPYPSEIRDYREGRSPITRRMYMESKEMHHGKEKQMEELEKYMKELNEDILEMIEDASPEEKTILAQKLNTLAGKIQ